MGTKRNDFVDYTETTDNGDRNQILATIFHIAIAYSRAYPNQKIFIRGRNPATARLYRGAINHEYEKIVKEFKVQGGIYNERDAKYTFEQFSREKHDDAFLFERK